MKRVFWDTNALLDILLRREPFFASTAQVWLKTEAGELEGMVSIPSLTTVFYLIEKSADRRTARSAVRTLCRVLQAVDSPAKAARLALESRQRDFEDAVQYHTARLAGADCVMTRNVRDFLRGQEGGIPVLTPEELLRALG